MSRYEVIVREEEAVAAQWEDEKAEPLAHGFLDLSDAEYTQLDRRLYALVGEEYIGSYSITTVDGPVYRDQNALYVAFEKGAGLDNPEDGPKAWGVWQSVKAG